MGLGNQSVSTVCYSICIFLTKYPKVWPLFLNFRFFTAKFSCVRKFRNFTVNLIEIPQKWFSHDEAHMDSLSRDGIIELIKVQIMTMMMMMMVMMIKMIMRRRRW